MISLSLLLFFTTISPADAQWALLLFPCGVFQDWFEVELSRRSLSLSMSCSTPSLPPQPVCVLRKMSFVGL